METKKEETIKNIEKIIKEEEIFSYIKILNGKKQEDNPSKIRKKLKEIDNIKSPIERESSLKKLAKEYNLNLSTVKKELEYIKEEESTKEAQEFLKKIKDSPVKVEKEDYLKCKAKGEDCVRLLEYWIAHYSDNPGNDWKEKPIEIEKFNVTVTLKNENYEEKVEEAVKNYYDKSDLAEKIWQIQPYFYDSSKIWWIWLKKSKRWMEVDETDMLNMVSCYSVTSTVQQKEKQEILEALKQFGRRRKPMEIKGTWIQFKDTIYDIETDECFKATPKYFVTNPVPWELSENEDTPEMDKLFEEWVGKDYVKTLKQIAAYCMLPDYPIHRLFCLIGEGSNGKSKFLEFITKLIGIQNITSTELEDLIGVRFEKAKLYKKSVCMMGETNFSNMRRTSLIKKLTGQDPIGGEKKNKNPFDFVNYAKLLISTNGLPYSEDKSDGFFRRWCIIDFPNKFEETNKVLDRIPEHEYNNFCKKSIKLLKELLQNMKFHNEGSVQERKKKYLDYSNPVNKFVEEECITGEGYEIPFFKFFEELNRFIKNNGYRELSKVEISRTLSREGFDIRTKRFTKGDGKESTWRMVVGVDLNYDETTRYEVIKDFSNLSVPQEISEKKEGDIIIFDKNIKDILETLEKEGYIKNLGGSYFKNK